MPRNISRFNQLYSDSVVLGHGSVTWFDLFVDTFSDSIFASHKNQNYFYSIDYYKKVNPDLVVDLSDEDIGRLYIHTAEHLDYKSTHKGLKKRFSFALAEEIGPPMLKHNMLNNIDKMIQDNGLLLIKSGGFAHLPTPKERKKYKQAFINQLKKLGYTIIPNEKQPLYLLAFKGVIDPLVIDSLNPDAQNLLKKLGYSQLVQSYIEHQDVDAEEAMTNLKKFVIDKAIDVVNRNKQRLQFEKTLLENRKLPSLTAARNIEIKNKRITALEEYLGELDKIKKALNSNEELEFNLKAIAEQVDKKHQGWLLQKGYMTKRTFRTLDYVFNLETKLNKKPAPRLMF